MTDRQNISKAEGIKNITKYYIRTQRLQGHTESLTLIHKLMTTAEGYAELIAFMSFYYACDADESLKVAMDIFNYRQRLSPSFIERVVFGEMPGVDGNSELNKN